MSFRLSAAAVVVLLIATGSPVFAQDIRVDPDVVYGHKLGLAMTMDVFRPEQPNGAGVLFIVSGGWYSNWVPPEQLQGRFQPLLEKGFTVFAVRHGSSPKFSIPEAVSDVRRSVRFIRCHAERFQVDPQRLGVFGYSAGGHLSLMLGTASDEGQGQGDEVDRTTNRVSAVVAFVAPTDLRIMVWEAEDHLPAYDRFPALDLDTQSAGEHSPLLHVTADDAPTLLIAGDQDELVPIQHSHNIYDALQTAKVTSELMVVEGAGHGLSPEQMERAMERTVAWFEKHLLPKK